MVIRVQCWYFKQSMGPRNRVGVGLSNRPGGYIGIRFMGSIKVKKILALYVKKQRRGGGGGNLNKMKNEGGGDKSVIKNVLLFRGGEGG
jgi:hypothetical protein